MHQLAFLRSGRNRFLCAALLSLLWMVVIGFVFGFYFETNDDRQFSEIFSGAMTGSPEYRSYYIHVILGYVLTLLYRITCAVPWYGLTLLFFQWLCHTAFTAAVLDACSVAAAQPADGGKIASGKLRLALIICGAATALLAYFSAGFTLIACIQFTSTASLLAITGYLVLCLQYRQRGTLSLGLFFLLEFLAFLLRSDSMLMIQPLGMCAFGGLCLAKHLFHKGTLRTFLRTVFLPLALVCGILLSCRAVTLTACHGQGWDEYEKINQGVTEITDYSCIPSYEEVSSILEKYNVSKEQYLAFFQYTIIERNLSGDCLLELASYAREHFTPLTPEEIVTEIRYSFHDSSYYGINRLVKVLWLVALLLALLFAAPRMLLPLAALFTSRMAIWAYLIYRGRIPFRVTYPLWILETLLLLLFLFLPVLREKKRLSLLREKFPRLSVPGKTKEGAQAGQLFDGILVPLAVLILCAFCGFCGLSSLAEQTKTLYARNEGERLYAPGMNELVAYCDANPDKRFFLDANCVLYYRGSALCAQPYHPRNCIISGCWYSGAPVFYDRIESYAPAGETIYLISPANMPDQTKMVTDYFALWRGRKGSLCDSITVSNGGSYEVYRF